jgi:hypothetical protein
MATVTPVYNWPVPTSTDYVKDGATSIEALGDAIDASLFSITNGRNVGLVPLVNTTFTSVSAVQVDNVFTTTYDSYRIILGLTGATVNDVPIRMRFVDGTTPQASADYYYGAIGVTNSGSTVNTYGGAVTNVVVAYGNATNTSTVGFTMDVLNPKPTQNTPFTWNASNFNGGNTFSYAGGGSFLAALGFEGIQIYPNSGTFSGNIKIYGYRNS